MMSKLAQVWHALTTGPAVPAAAFTAFNPPRASQIMGDPVTITTSEGIANYLRTGGVTRSGALVTPDSALNVAIIFRCIELLADTVAGLPKGMMEELKDGTRKEAADHPLHELIRHQPNEWQTAFEFVKLMEWNRQMRGRAFARIVRSRGRVIGLVPLHPDRVTVKQAPDLKLVFVYRRQDGSEVMLPQSDVFYLKDATLDGVSCMSRLTRMREAIGLALRTEEHGSRLFAQGVKPGGVFEMEGTLSTDAYERLKTSLEETYSGSENAHKTMLLEEGMSFKPVTMSSDDAQFLQTRQFQRGDLAIAMGVPPILIGDSEKTSSWGTGIEQIGIGFLQYRIDPLVDSWVQALRRDCIAIEDRRRFYVHVNLNGLMRSSAKDRAAYFSKALGSGGSGAWLTPNEVRKEEGRNPVKGGDILFQPSMFTAGSAQPLNEDDGDVPQ